MFGFDLVVSRSVAHALEVLADHPHAMPVAGATDFIPAVRAGRWRPQLAVDISRLEDLRYLDRSGSSLEIGALTSHAELASSPLVRQFIPVLAEAAGCVGDGQVRARATLGGNLCTASPAADTVPALLVLDASVRLLSRAGERCLRLEDFLQGPGRTALAPGELLAGVTVPLPPAGSGMAFEKLGRRKVLACSVVNAAALLAPLGGLAGEEGCIHHARLALGAVAPVAVRCRPSEECLVGRPPDAAVFDEAAAAAVRSIQPIGDVRASAEYRRAVSVPLARRCLWRAWQAAGGRTPSTVGAIHELPQSGAVVRVGAIRPPLVAPARRGELPLRAGEANREHQISLTVNGQLHNLAAGGAATLLELLRDQLGLTGTKDGCGEGDCGACTVIVDGQAVKSCLVLAVQAHGSAVTTVEGLAGADGCLHPLQIAFAEAGAVQCGYCTPGMLMAALALLDARPRPTPGEVRAALAGNLCRCTGYAKIVAAVQQAARVMEARP